MCDVFKEAEYKVATIDWLINKGEIKENAVLINELPVDNFSRRVDLAVANGKLHAFEIKSDVDSLRRLEGQIETYLSFFDKVTVVCSSRFTQKALNSLPREVEIIELNHSNTGDYNLKVRRRGRIQRINSCSNYLSFVDKRYLIGALKRKGLTCHLGESRLKINKIFSTLPKSYWRNLVLDYLKDKYKTTFESFIDNKEMKTSVDDLYFLSPKNQSVEVSDYKENHIDNVNEWDFREVNKSNFIDIKCQTIDISSNLHQFGFVTSSPVKIIPRLIKK